MKSVTKILFLVLVLISACQHSQKQANKNIKSGESNITSTEYKTKSGKKFIVHIDNSVGASICEVQIETGEFTAVNTTHRLGTIDPVKEVFVTDLDKNGYEEIYLVTQSAGSGSYSNIYGIASNNDRSATPVYVPVISEKQMEKGGLFEGYMGHNNFYLEQEKLINAFPVYKKDDTNAHPTGGNRKIEYRLVAGEAGWILEAFQLITE
ncbi:hypothetical protein N9164_08020 [Draconibacterium sp.]|nr:hypothetical protein [Draconibacterium sp.]